METERECGETLGTSTAPTTTKATEHSVVITRTSSCPTTSITAPVAPTAAPTAASATRTATTATEPSASAVISEGTATPGGPRLTSGHESCGSIDDIIRIGYTPAFGQSQTSYVSSAFEGTAFLEGEASIQISGNPTSGHVLPPPPRPCEEDLTDYADIVRSGYTPPFGQSQVNYFTGEVAASDLIEGYTWQNNI